MGTKPKATGQTLPLANPKMVARAASPPAMTVPIHVEATTAAVRSRVGWRQTGFTINFPWEIRLDHFVWNQQ